MTTRFAITWDYRCPFARIANDHVVQGLVGGADWEVDFVPFSLGQVHVEEGQPDIWETPELDSGLLALQVGVVVRDEVPELFPAVHRAIFDARHKEGAHIRDEQVLRTILGACGADADVVFGRIATGEPLQTIRREHEAVATSHEVWGVPTFIVGDQAVFVRLMEDSANDTDLAVRTVERVLDLIGGWPELNEYKHTSIAR